jgi:integrase
MDTKRKSYVGVGGGIYTDPRTGNFYHRPTINGKKTFRLLDVRTLKLARALKNSLDNAQAMHAQGLEKDPYAAPAPTVLELVTGYMAAGCPRVNHQQRTGSQLKQELSRLNFLQGFWNTYRADLIKQRDCLAYAELRRKSMRTGTTGNRSIDLELSTLSSVLSWGFFTGKLDSNPLTQRPKFSDGKAVRHCRDCMPKDAAELHNLARALFGNSQSEALGWQLLIEAMTGCRTSEVLRMRWDATAIRQAGFIDGQHLWLERSKGGVNPWCDIHPALAQTLQAMAAWRVKRNLTANPWFIPSPRKHGERVDLVSLTHALKRIGPAIAGAHRTSHGLRAYFVTVRRSMGIADAQVAAEIGDSTGAAIIASTYGALPPNWTGGAGLSWMVEKPAWLVLDLPENVVQLGAVVAG